MNSIRKAPAVVSLVAGTALMLFPSCEKGIMGGLYDEPEEVSEFGFVKTETLTGYGTVYINTSVYANWVYLDFAEAETVTVDMTAGDPEPGQWDMAVHRYDVKTNGDAAFVSDIMTDDVIAIDMSGMMQGNIVYAEDWYNPELSRWLDVDTSTMPPIYTKSDNVFVLRLPDGRDIAIRLDNYMDGNGTKGYMTIQYKTLTGEVEL